jgi:hypothetical protein
MAVRATMSALIAQVRVLINDAAGGSQVFDDQTIQDVLDLSRQDVTYVRLRPSPTFTGGTISYLDYYAELGNWEGDLVLKQYLSTTVTPATSELIVGHWTFATSTLPPVYIATGKTYDVYRAAADLLERMAARWVLSYGITVDGQNLQRNQVTTALQALARTYRAQQRAHTIKAIRSDLASKGQEPSLGATSIDYMASGNGS